MPGNCRERMVAGSSGPTVPNAVGYAACGNMRSRTEAVKLPRSCANPGLGRSEKAEGSSETTLMRSDVKCLLDQEGTGPRRRLRHAGRGPGGDLRVHRGVLQWATPSLLAGVRLPGGVRTIG